MLSRGTMWERGTVLGRGTVWERGTMWGEGVMCGAGLAPICSPSGNAALRHPQTHRPPRATHPSTLLPPRRPPCLLRVAAKAVPGPAPPALTLAPTPAPAFGASWLPQEQRRFPAPSCRHRGALPRPVFAASASAAASPAPPLPPKPAPKSSRLSDALWPGLGAFLSFCGLAAMDHLLRSKRLTMSLASFAAVSSLLFAAPQAPVSQRPRVLMAHLGASLIGVAAMAALGPTWMARCVAVGLSVSFMLLADCLHPPAAGLPVIFIDGPKFHHLGWWFPLIPAFAGCFWLFLMQEIILFLKDRVQF